MFEMKTEDAKDKKEKSAQGKQTSKENAVEETLSELHESVWSVVSFEKVMHQSLTYDEAAQKMQELARKKTSGLCIITDAAARKISK